MGSPGDPLPHYHSGARSNGLWLTSFYGIRVGSWSLSIQYFIEICSDGMECCADAEEWDQVNFPIGDDFPNVDVCFINVPSTHTIAFIHWFEWENAVECVEER